MTLAGHAGVITKTGKQQGTWTHILTNKLSTEPAQQTNS